MAEQPKAESQSVFQRLKPLLDVFGAILLFGSWIISNTLTQRAQEQASIHQGIIDRVRQFRLYEDFARSIVEIQSDLARTSNLVEYTARRVKSLEGDAEPLPNAPVWTGMTALQIREINDLLDELDRYAARLPVSGDIRGNIDQARTGVQELSEAFHSAHDEYEQLVEATGHTSTLSPDDVVAEKKLRQRVDRLWHQYDTAKQSMLQVGDDLVRSASRQSAAANQLAAHFKRISYVFYILGTLTRFREPPRIHFIARSDRPVDML